MNSKLLTLIVATALCANLVACDSKDQKKGSPKADPILVVDPKTKEAEVPVPAKDGETSENAKPEMKIASAEEIAIAGEQLISASSFHLADQIFDIALHKDPTNKRALFYKNVLRPMMTLKGMAARLKPGFEQRGQEAEFKQLLEAAPQSPILDFAMASGKQNITTEKEAQDALVEVRNAFIESVRWFKKNSDVSLTLNLNPTIFADLIKDRENEDACYVQTVGDKMELICDKDFRKNLWTAKVNGADLLVMQQYYAGYVLYLLPYTNYSLEGYEKLAKKLENRTPDEAMELIMSEKNFLTLRKDQAFSFIKELGTDLKAAAKWAIEYQDRLCTKKPHARRGHVVPGEFCIEDTRAVEQVLVKLDRALNGPVTTTFEVEGWVNDENNGYGPYWGVTKKTALVNYSVLWSNPIQDLKETFKPTSLNECAKYKGFKDTTLGGLLPEGNADELIDSTCE
ncbi:hypothetical protein [Bdellovibrio sp. HCB2-146]|uniref:hypothetical protein n=1 Tax=Bdellovibrio sp. HCB2-146 TaxID=3394362 RepID=UPI0039BC5029